MEQVHRSEVQALIAFADVHRDTMYSGKNYVKLILSTRLQSGFLITTSSELENKDEAYKEAFELMEEQVWDLETYRKMADAYAKNTN